MAIDVQTLLKSELPPGPQGPQGPQGIWYTGTAEVVPELTSRRVDA